MVKESEKLLMKKSQFFNTLDLAENLMRDVPEKEGVRDEGKCYYYY